MTNANSPSAAMENPVQRQSRKCKPLNRLLWLKFGTKNPTSNFPVSAMVNTSPFQITTPLPNFLMGTWKPIEASYNNL